MTRSTGYGQFCPIARAAEILAERWTLLVVREVLCGSKRFSEIQRGVPRMSSALLSQRLRDLVHTGIVERRSAPDGRSWEYHPTGAGREVFPILESLGNWAQRWVRDDLTDDPNLDPDLLMWDIRRNVTAEGIPSKRRFVVRFEFAGVPASRRRYWLVFEQGEADLCIKDPGFEVDLHVSSPLRDLIRVWLGHESIAEAVRRGRVKLEGARGDVKAFRSWFALSSFAPEGQMPAPPRALRRAS